MPSTKGHPPYTTSGWSGKLVGALKSNAFLPNFGAAGPLDASNTRILTHSFAHRTHMVIHGHWFAREFRSWFSDDFFSLVYGTGNTFIGPSGVQMHHMHAAIGQRYHEVSGDLALLTTAVKRHRRLISEYVKRFHPDDFHRLQFCGSLVWAGASVASRKV